MNALILVDLQNDFAPSGALPVPRGDEVVAVANRLLALFPCIVATQDWHPASHKSFAINHPGRQAGEVIELSGIRQILWPVHCVSGSTGAELLPGLDKKRIRKTIQKGTDPEIDSYSAFFDNGHRKSTELKLFLNQREIWDVFIMGLATDYCVKFSVLDSIRLGFKTHLILDGCRGVELAFGDVERAVEEMRAAGVEILDSQELIH